MTEGENRKTEKKKQKKTALETAYAYLASRMRTTEEVRKHLEGRDYGEEDITEALNELIGLRYLDDHIYALRYYEYNREKKRGSLRAERELIEKGISRETARFAKEDFLFEQKVDEFEDALEVARKEIFVPSDIYGGAPQLTALDDRSSAKIARRLENRGFAKGDIFRVLDALRKEIAEAAESTGI